MQISTWALTRSSSRCQIGPQVQVIDPDDAEVPFDPGQVL